MDAVLRGVAVYCFLLVILRFSGKRTLAQITTFDFVLLLAIGEATQQGLLGNDFSITNAALVILTLVGLDVGLSLVKERYKQVEKLVDSAPVILIEDGHLHQDRLKKARVDEEDIKYAVLERSGGISIIPIEQKR